MSSSPEAAGGKAPPRYIGFAAAGAALLAVAGGVAFYFASQNAHHAGAAGAISVNITASACEPNEVTVPAGRRTFEIVNQSSRPVEWEIMKGVMVVEERENIAPGFRQTLSAQLAAGDYQMTCGLLSNPPGIIHVTPSNEATTVASAPTLRAFIGPLAEYQFFVSKQSNGMVRDVQALADAIKAGDLEQAKAAYEPARLSYKRLEAVIYRFSDLVNKINPSASYLEKREADPAFTGFQKIEYDLFAKGDLQDAAAAVDQLVTSIQELQTRLKAIDLKPVDLMNGGSHLAEQLASGRIATGESVSAHDDLAEFQANLEGLRKIADLTVPVIQASSAPMAEALQKAVASAQQQIDGLKQGDGFPTYDKIDAEKRKALAKSFEDIEHAFDQIGASLSAEMSGNG